MLHLATKAFWPGRVPFPVMHVDTGHNFPEVIAVSATGTSPASESSSSWPACRTPSTPGRVHETPGQSRNPLQTTTLLDAIAEHRFDAVLGGARRDEEKSRAKERVFSVRDDFGQWDPRNQRPELWDLYNGRHRPGEHVRVLPAVELDRARHLGLHRARGHRGAQHLLRAPRPVFQRDGMLLAVTAWTEPCRGEIVTTESVRYRTVGDATCTGAVRSTAGRRRRCARRDRRRDDLRARRNASGRPHQRSGDGRPQAQGYF